MKNYSYQCEKCKKNLDSFESVYFSYWKDDECRGKTCPDCGKVRKLGTVKGWVSTNSRGGCFKCRELQNVIINGVCADCFFNFHGQKGCVCFYKAKVGERNLEGLLYFCPLCEKTHLPELLCKDCGKEQENKSKCIQILPIQFYSLLVGSCFIGFFLGWLLLVKLCRKKIKKKKQHLKK